MYKGAMLTITCLVLCTGLVFGQEDTQEMESQGNGIIVVSYFKCDYSKLQDAIKLANEVNAPILNRFVDEGKLINWGILSHLWGDEWNLITYYSAENLSSFEKAFDAMFAEIMETNPDYMNTWSGMCSEHKDNIYSVVNAYSGGGNE
ncbi:MAG: hypothetical protein WD022_08570 [Balneolaceae bacterium]